MVPDPPVVVIVALYGVPTVPFGSTVVVIARGELIVIVSDCVAVAPLASVT